MLYFKTIPITEADGTKVEAAIRQFAVKRHTPLDLQSSVTEVGTDKLFLGLEKENNIQVIRLRTTFERFLPRVIIRFDKARGFTEYRIRYSLLSNFLFALLALAVVFNIIHLLNSRQLESESTTPFVLLFLFLFLTFIELRLTQAYIKSAINKTQLTNS